MDSFQRKTLAIGTGVASETDSLYRSTLLSAPFPEAGTTEQIAHDTNYIRTSAAENRRSVAIPAFNSP